LFNMRFGSMFITAVCVLFLLKLRWPRKKSFYDLVCYTQMSVLEDLLPTHTEKTLRAMKAPRAVKRITFERTEAVPSETLYVSVPKLHENELLVPGSLALRFDNDLTGGHANSFLVQNATRALVDKLTVKFEGTILQDTVGYDIY